MPFRGQAPGCLCGGHELLHIDRLNKIMGWSPSALSTGIDQGAMLYSQNERNISKRDKSHR